MCICHMCRYTLSYAEGSAVIGSLVQDQVWMSPIWNASAPAETVRAPTGVPSFPISFGCDNMETGEIYRQKADGIMGLADDRLSIITQLSEAQAIEPEFTICFGQTGGGLCGVLTVCTSHHLKGRMLK